MDSYLDNMLMFNPFSPNTIVKNYDLQFSMPQNGLGNVIAIQGSATTDVEEIGSINHRGTTSLKTLTRQFKEIEKLERNKVVKDNQGNVVDTSQVYVRSLPTFGSDLAAS